MLLMLVWMKRLPYVPVSSVHTLLQIRIVGFQNHPFKELWDVNGCYSSVSAWFEHLICRSQDLWPINTKWNWYVLTAFYSETVTLIRIPLVPTFKSRAGEHARICI